MGRTIHYSIPKSNPIPARDFKAVEQIQKEYNQGFTWTCENLGFERLSWYPRWHERFPDSALPKGMGIDETYGYIKGLMKKGYTLYRLNQEKYIWIRRGGYLGKDYSASGFTKVRGDEWNAWLVLRFLTWVSKRFPDWKIKVCEEGDFILVRYIILQAGKPEVNQEEVEHRRAFLNKMNLSQDLQELEKALELASQGIFYAEVMAKDYLNYKEFLNLPIPREEAEKMTIEAISQYLAFPGEDKA